MSERFIKFIPSEKSDWLLKNHPFAFLLLTLIAQRARRTSGNFDGLEIGQALIGDHESIGATRGQYRHALKVLNDNKFIQIHVKSRNGHFATIKTTIKGTLVSIIDSTIWNINLEDSNHQSNHPATIKQPSNNHEQERIRKNKNEKEEDIPQSASLLEEKVVSLDFSNEKKHKPKKEFSQQAISLAEYFYSSKKNKVENSKDIKRTLLKRTQDALEFDEMLKTYKDSEIKKCIDYGHANEFWKSIILTPKKLKKNIETLLIQLSSNFKSNNKNFPEENKKLAENMEKTYVSNTHRIDVLSKGVEITPLSGQCHSEFISYSLVYSAFKETLMNTIRKKKFEQKYGQEKNANHI